MQSISSTLLLPGDSPAYTVHSHTNPWKLSTSPRITLRSLLVNLSVTYELLDRLFPNASITPDWLCVDPRLLGDHTKLTQKLPRFHSINPRYTTSPPCIYSVATLVIPYYYPVFPLDSTLLYLLVTCVVPPSYPIYTLLSPCFTTYLPLLHQYLLCNYSSFIPQLPCLQSSITLYLPYDYPNFTTLLPCLYSEDTMVEMLSSTTQNFRFRLNLKKTNLT